MSGPRHKKVAAALREELSRLLLESVKDPRVRQVMITITEVRPAPDLKSAEVRVSFGPGAEDKAEPALEVLRRAAGFLRGEVARRLNLKRAPELRFVMDRGAEMMAYIDEVRRQDREGSS